MSSHLTQERLKQFVHYDPETGLVTSTKDFNRRKRGAALGSLRPDGYIKLCIDRKSYLLHRLIWFYMTGKWPLQVDHLNSVRSDNRWCNLREATVSQNLRSRVMRGGTSVYPGVSWCKRDSNWIAQASLNNRTCFIGNATSEKECYSLYLMWVAENLGEREANILHNRVLAAVH
jgi:hypothetical protein